MIEVRMLTTAAIAAAIAILGPAPADGASFTVSPIQIYLSTKQPSAILSVRNDSTESMRFQLTAVKWDQSETGEMQLAPTTDVVFFPRLLTLAKGESRNVRVGLSVSFGDVEKTYRLFIEELPPIAGTTDGGQTTVRMRTRMGVPIFATPAVGRSGAAISELKIESRRLVIRLANRGTVHVIPDTIRIIGQSADGKPVFDKTINSWYVLAAHSQRFNLALNDQECASAVSLAADVRIGETIHLTQTAPVAAGSCTPAASPTGAGVR